MRASCRVAKTLRLHEYRENAVYLASRVPPDGDAGCLMRQLCQPHAEGRVTYDATRLFDNATNAHPWNATDPSKNYAGLPFLYQVTAADVLVDNVVVEAD